MAITSYPFEGQSVSESQYDRLFREFQDSGVAGSAGSSDLKVTAGSGSAVNVAPGFAVIRGHGFQSTAVETVPLATGGAAARTDLIVLRLSLTANAISLAVLSGATPARGDGDIYEVALASVTVPAGATSASQFSIVDSREFVGARVRAWTTAGRDAGGARVGQIGFNTDKGVLEYWVGTGWKTLVDTGSVNATVTWASISGKPTTFTPATHTHAWADISGKPTTFAPSAHKHPASDITGSVPSAAFATDAQGSKRVRSSSPAGTGWYSVWVDGNDNFCHNTSSIRYKENVRDAGLEPDAILGLRPVVYDRRASEVDGVMVEGQKDEFGLIAEEVEKHLPELVQYDKDGQVEALRYDLIAVAAIPLLKQLSERVETLEARLAALQG